MKTKKAQIKRKAFSDLFFIILFLIFIIFSVVGFYFIKQFIYQKKIDSAVVLTKSSPVNYINGVVLWLETVDNVNFIDKQNNSLIYSWQNKPKGSFSQVNKNNQPIYSKLGINNLPALYFEGKSFMTDASFQNIVKSATIFMVIKPTNMLGKKTILSKSDDKTNFRFLINVKEKNYHYEFCLFAEQEKCFISNYLNKKTPDEISVQIVSIVADSYNDNKDGLQLFVNGDVLSSFTTADSFFAESTSSLNIGRTLNQDQVATGYFDGYIGEIIIYNKVLNDLQRKLIEDYLKNKWH
jgi:hypothetical protein